MNNGQNAYPIPAQVEEVTELFGLTERVSISSNGLEVEQDSWYSAVSADGRYIAFVSSSDDLVDDDDNEVKDIFVHDRNTGSIERVSLGEGNVEGNGESYSPAISADGRFVAFESVASNLVSGGDNQSRDIFVRDRQSGTTELISVVNGQAADGNSRHPAVSDDGRYVAFYSLAADIALNDDNGVGDVFVYDRQSGTMTAVSLTSGGEVGDGESRNTTISGDGQYIAFESMATDLVEDDGNDASDIFLYSLQGGSLERVSVNSDNDEGEGHSFNADLSADGRYVVFQSQAENLWVGDSNEKSDIFVYYKDNANGIQVERASVAVEGGQPNGNSGYAAISADGRYVTYSSFANNLAGGEIYGSNLDVYFYDRQANETERVSADMLGQEPDGASVNPDISADGRFVTFDSTATNLVENDLNSRIDVFIRDRMPPVAVDINYVSGSPGSYFTISGDRFMPESEISLVVNGFELGKVTTDAEGGFTAVLATDEADLGGYILSARGGTLVGSLGFVMDEASAVRPQETEAAVFNLPAGIAYSHFSHLPFTVGK
jgi:Tol biopolymer transport system component